MRFYENGEFVGRAVIVRNAVPEYECDIHSNNGALGSPKLSGYERFMLGLSVGLLIAIVCLAVALPFMA